MDSVWATLPSFTSPTTVVLGDVEVDQLQDGLEGLQSVEIQPLVTKRFPQRLDHRIGLRDLDLGPARGGSAVGPGNRRGLG